MYMLLASDYLGEVVSCDQRTAKPLAIHLYVVLERFALIYMYLDTILWNRSYTVDSQKNTSKSRNNLNPR